MPVGITTTAASDPYANPFVGPVDHTAQVRVDLSGLTEDEVDADGYLKPGVPLTRGGLRVGVQAAAGSAVAAAYSGNTGNGAMGAVTVGAGAKAGVYKLTVVEPAGNAGTFVVEDPDGVVVGTGTVGVAFSAGGLSFTLADGATDFVAGDGFNITVTLTAGAAETARVFGCVVEATKLPITLPRTNTTLASETGDCDVAVCTHGVVNRDVVEDNLGRSLTAAELAGFVAAGCHLALTAT